MSDISQRERELLNEVAALRRRIAREETKEFSGSVSLGTVYPVYSGVPTANAVAYWTGNGTIAAASYSTSAVARYSGVPTAGAMAYWTANGTIAAAGFGTSTVTQYSGTQSAGVFAYFTGTGTVTANGTYGTATMPIYNGTPAANDMTYWSGSNRITNAPFGTADVALLAGRGGGQTLKGGTASGDDLTLESTSHATKGDVLIQPTSGNVAIGGNTVASIKLTVIDGAGRIRIDSTTNSQLAGFVLAALGASGTSRSGGLFYAADETASLSFFGITADNSNYSAKFFTSGVAIGVATPSAKLHVEQTSTTAAIPTLRLKQSDLSEEFIRFESTVSAGNPINTTALGAYYGRVRVYVEGVGAKWLALYD